MKRAQTIIACGSAFFALAVSTGAFAGDFYQGKEISLYVGAPPGGPYDSYARLLARHFGRHVPGAPTVTVYNVPGAGGRTAMGFIANVAPKDGTAIGTTVRSIPYDPLMGVPSPFDVTRIPWIGSTNSETSICVAWFKSGFKTLEDVRRRQMVVGKSGPSSTDSIIPHAMNALIGTKFKVVSGYEASSETQIAMERGEVDGRCGMTWNGLKSIKSDWLHDHKVNILSQFALDKDPELQGVPSVLDEVKTEADRAVVRILAAPDKAGEPFFAPPGVSPEKVRILREAFAATMKDPAFLADAASENLEIKPTSGKDIETLVAELYKTPPDLVKRAAAISGRQAGQQ